MRQVRLARSSALTLLLVGSVTLTTLAQRSARSTASAAVPAALELPWNTLSPAVLQLPPEGTPLAILYVQSRCPHCTPTAVALDSISMQLGVQPLIVMLDNAHDAAAWATALRIASPVARDTGRAWMKALQITGVPTLLTYDHRGRGDITVGAIGPGAMRRRLESLQ